MSNTETHRILLLVESQEEAERLITLFREGGHATRAHRITSEQDFSEHLQAGEWDLLIGDDKHPDLEFETACKLIQDKELDIPAIQLIDSRETGDIVAGFEKGAQDVIETKADRHLVRAAQREINNCRQRCERKRIASEFEETNQRAVQLLSSSQEAIAYVVDGMHIEANEAYANAFGFEDAEELTSLPIIDLIAENDQERFKTFLRHFPADQGESADINFTAEKDDGSQFAAHLSLSPSSFDGEPCTQLLMHVDDGSLPNAMKSTVDEITGLQNRSYLEDQISTASLQSSKGMGPACFLYINVDNFSDVQDKYGIFGGDIIINHLAQLLKTDLPSEHCLTRFGDGALALLMTNQSSEAALDRATLICQQVEESICEVDGHTVQYTCSIGISPLGSRPVKDVIENAYGALSMIYIEGEKSTAKVMEQNTKPAQKASTAESLSFDEAIETDRFRLLFQPIISLRGDSQEHYEVFLRMLDDNDSEIPPSEFLHNARDTKLDRWIILEATKALSIHRADGHDTKIIINLTANVLHDSDLVQWMGVALKAANLPADCVIFQFSEADIGDNLTQANQVTKALHAMNIKVSITGFGKNADPVKTLKHVSCEYVKIDGSFTLALQDNQGDPQVLKALVSSISENDLISIVPCVENAGVLATLWQLGVNYIQGHYLQPPSPTMDYEFTEIA